jgi:hypothetical protein
MPQVPFPHMLSSRNELAQGIIRVVTPDEIDGQLCWKDGRELNSVSRLTEDVLVVVEFSEIKEKRPAKRNWSNWSVHPTYYNGIGKMKRVFESQISVSVT